MALNELGSIAELDMERLGASEDNGIASSRLKRAGDGVVVLVLLAARLVAAMR